MKKIISMLLVFTMIMTTLMGVMVIDVNAATSSEKAKRDATDTTKIMIPFGASSLPNTLASMKLYGRGDWYAYGYSYSDEDLAKETTNKITGTKTPEVNFLSTSYIKNPLFGGADAEMIKFDWKEVTITDESKKALDKNPKWFTNSAVSANYLRVRILSPRQWTSINPGATANYGKITEDVVYQYTFYAYTDPTTCLDRDGSQSKIELMHLRGSSEAAGTVVFSDQVPSAHGVPHKIDMIFSGNTSNYYVNVYVDGVQLNDGKSKEANTSEVKFEPRFGNISLKDKTLIEIKNTDWYITSPASVPGANITPVTQNDVTDDLITVPEFFSVEKATKYRTDDFITGVIDTLDASIEEVLKTTKAGDKIVYIDTANYNNPARLFDTSVADPTVKLISRTTGQEVSVADTTGTTMDDYYFMVKGIYIIPEKIDAENWLDYNVDTKSASVNCSISDYNGVMLVGAYNEKGKLLILDVSGSGDKEFTADFGNLDLTTVKEYKVFAYNSLAECKPIMANYTILNHTYVAPAE